MNGSYHFIEHVLKREILMDDADVELPTDVPIGSVAYTADLTYLAIWDGDEWKQVGGSD